MEISFGAGTAVGKVRTFNRATMGNNFTVPVLMADTVSFSGNNEFKKVNVDKDTAEFVANSLSTSTSGHRATYGSETFNPEVVELLTAGVGQYAKDVAASKGTTPVVVVGGDTREATRKSLPLIKDTLLNQGVDVLYIKEPVPTPLLALMSREEDADISILLTASHNPWTDGGYNLVTNNAAIAAPDVTKQVARNVIDTADRGGYRVSRTQRGEATEVNPYEMYKKQIDDYGIIDWEKIRNSGISIYYDGLQGTGEKVFPRLLDDYQIPLKQIHSGKKEGPNPIRENLEELSQEVKDDPSEIKVGLSNDGDADRFGVIDENGNFITPNDVLLLVAHHLTENKGIKGDIIRSQATSSQLDLFAENNGLNVIQTPVGFKYIGEDIINKRNSNEGDILVAGEESGGLTVNGHIPEKDGIIAILTIIDMMAQEEKPLSQILEEVKADLNTEFRADSFSKKLPEEKDKEIIMGRMQDIYEGALSGDTKFGNFEIDVDKTKENTDKMEEYRKGGDGVKLYFTDGSSVLVRKSGTEPKVKAYIETYNKDAEVADNNVVELRSELDKIFDIKSNVSFTGHVNVDDSLDLDKYGTLARLTAFDIRSRAGQEGQFLNWINVLPEEQLKNLDNIYEKAENAKEGGYTDLAVIGIGGSRHTTEAMMGMLGKNSNVHFYSGVDPESFERFKSGLDLDKTKFLVVSKSGGTLETTTAYENVKKTLQEHTGKEDVSDRIIAMTDASSEKSNLRRAVDRGEIGISGLVHDDVGGRFSVFDDATLFTMAFAGVDKNDTKDMLKASLSAQREFLSPEIQINEALQLAAFNVDSKMKGKNRRYVEYFSDAFYGTTLWDKQLSNESLKSRIATETNVGPGYLHYNAEADLDDNNTESFYTFVHPESSDKTTNAVINGVLTAYRGQHPVSEIVLDDLSPKEIARFIELKHFETLYTGGMLRRIEGDVTEKDKPVPEVLQPNVEKYKKEVKKYL